jgi:hypothetical protein
MRMAETHQIRTIEQTHPYFSEVSQFAQMVVANMSSTMLTAANQTIRDLVEFVNTIAETGNTNIKGAVNEHTMTPIIAMGAAKCPDSVHLYDADAVHRFLSGRDATPLDTIRYEIVTNTSMNQLDRNHPGRTTWTGSDPTARFEMLTAYLVGGAFERNKSLFFRNYGRDPSNWDLGLQFFRHLRNGCFHSNTFNITPIRHGPKSGQPQIDPTRPPSWQTCVMPSDSVMNGQRVVGGFFPVPFVLPFLDDMGTFV